MIVHDNPWNCFPWETNCVGIVLPYVVVSGNFLIFLEGVWAASMRNIYDKTWYQRKVPFGSSTTFRSHSILAICMRKVQFLHSCFMSAFIRHTRMLEYSHSKTKVRSSCRAFFVFLLFVLFRLWCRKFLTNVIMMTSWNWSIPCYLPFVRGIHRSSADSLTRGHWREILLCSLTYAWKNGLTNIGNAHNLRRHCAHVI